MTKFKNNTKKEFYKNIVLIDEMQNLVNTIVNALSNKNAEKQY